MFGGGEKEALAESVLCVRLFINLVKWDFNFAESFADGLVDKCRF